ncbi:hypothetical protein TRVA0_001S09406 [Trichomonascus vanleenenianus]|uniref:uncharacterized protein n=1 Tax=Trichomonascus vanleenenianus TaxID=2268995 RepID=UPI003ECB9477
MAPLKPYEKIAQQVQQHRDETARAVDKFFPPLAGSKHWDPLPEPLPRNVTGLPKQYLDPADFAIVERDPLALVGDIKARKVTAMQVAGAYLRAAIVSQRLVNCVCEFLPEFAYKRARELDEHLEKTGELMGPLHGIPISLKEMIDFGGHRVNRSIAALYDNIVEEDAHLVKVLKQAGANFHIRTTQPQILLHVEGDSQLTGITENPFNRDLTSGGSSAGEGASLGLHSSCIGIGTDIGGSIRWPASVQGQYGFKPTCDRIPGHGLAGVMPGPLSIPATAGPLTRTLESTILTTRVLLECRPFDEDPRLLGIPWQNNVLEGVKKLRIGILRDDGIAMPHPPVQRALEEVASKLRAAKEVDGIEIELVEVAPYDHKRAWDIIMGLYVEDGGEFLRKKLAETEEEPLPLTEWALSQPQVKRLDIHELWQRNVVKNQYRYEYAQYWNKLGLDALICPAGAGGAATHGNSKYWPYQAQWNLLDYPALVFPVTAVKPEIDVKDETYEPRNADDKFVYDLYDAETFRDAPIGLQLVGKRSQDEKVLEIAQLIDNVVNPKN